MMQDYIPNPSLKNEDPIEVLRLIRSENIGPMTFYQLMKFAGSASKAIEAAPEMSRRGGRKRAINIISRAQAKKEFDAVQKFGAKLVMYGQPDYPKLLQTIPDAPPILTVFGHTHLLSKPKLVALVGARNASTNGCRFAQKMARELGETGCVIVSGLARGIDTAAHQASLKTGTVAVIGGSIDHIYPPENKSLYDEIKETGAIISEAPFGTKPLAHHFPARNRIIAGMSHGLLVVEASIKSGSLITANYANDYGREIFAVPGSPMDPRCKGTNRLLKDGAHMAESAEDILFQIGNFANPPLAEHERPHFPETASEPVSETDIQKAQDDVIAALSYNPTPLDALLASTGLSPHLLLAVTLELELAGRVQRHAGGQIALTIENETSLGAVNE